MTPAIALIRGINVGGKHALPMATLRTLCEQLGWRDVATYIQSGNVVFRAPARSLAPAAKRLEAAIEQAVGFRPGVVVRTLADLRRTIAANPFPAETSADPARVLVMFLAATPTAAAKKAFNALTPNPERIALARDAVFIHFPNGIAGSKFQSAHVEKALKTPGTCRNWNSVLKVLAMAEALEAAGG